MQLLVKVLIRQALRNNPANPRDWLDDLQATKWTSVNTQSGQIIGTSVNGKTVQLQALPGINLEQVIFAIELAIETLDAGLTYPRTESVAFFR
jgi:hypothetical protein